VVRWWSLKGLRQLKSNSVLPRLRMPLLHDITIYITKLSRASARYLSLCLLVQPIPFPAPQGHPYPTAFQLSATLLLFPVGCCAFLRLPRTPPNLLFLN
jgi:hypothetical protein